MWVACKTKVTYVPSHSPGCAGMAKCHPTSVTQSHRKEGMETMHPTSLGGGSEQQHPQT